MYDYGESPVPIPFLQEKKGQDTRAYTKAYSVFSQERYQELSGLLDKLRHENQTLRSPCPTCGNLVKPELLGQHNEAYHSERN